MRFIVYNTKGGVGKTTLAKDIAEYFDATIFDLDPYSQVEKTLKNDRVLKIALDEAFPIINSGDVVCDFGGFADTRLDVAAKGANLIVVPFNPTINSLATTLECYNSVKLLDVPILLVANAVIKDSDAQEAFDYLAENTGDELNYFIIPHSRAIQTAENKGVSIIELSGETGLNRHTYRKISKIMNNFMLSIKEYI
jgi:cellulose biosynthesis protein BcsQ